MAENLTQYPHGRVFLQQLQQHGLSKDAVLQLSETAAQLIAEALRTGPQQQQLNGISSSAKAAHQRQKQQQAQQQQAAAAPTVRDLQQAEAVLQGLPLTIPRGKFDVAFFSDCLQVSNKQTSAVVPYSSILHVLVIDAIPQQPNTTNVVLVMKSGCAVTQGKNQLDLVCVQTKNQPELCIQAPAACSHFGEELRGAAPIVLSQLLASYLPDVNDDTFLTADSSVFSSAAGDLMIHANKGATPGWLVPLSAGLCYIGKPGRFMPSSSISKVWFHRVGGSSSTFDITIKLTAAAAAAVAGSGSSSSSSKPLELGQIDAAELLKLQGYFADQGIQIGTEDDDDDDDDAAAAAAAAPRSRGVAGGRAASAAATAAGGGNGDDDEDDDDDYDPEAAEEPASKRQRSEGAAAAAGKEGVGEEEEEEEDQDASSEYEGSDDDSEDVSLVDEDALDDDDDDDE